ncbi:MAG: ROK family protein [Anaerolineae bacterium]|nr:ROK family protein [Thermoflexales bacterium]MDW8395436.1 ROK family protein [Anaerolineae bacterium]
MSSRYVVGVDLGGTKILAAVIDPQGEVVGTGKKSTHAEKGPEAVVHRIGKAMDEALEAAKVRKDRIAAIGIGVPGVVDRMSGVVISATNLPGWHHVPLSRVLRDWHDVPVVVSNDVRVAAVGEHRVGAGRGVHSLVAVFIGTGIGGGVILNDCLIEGFRGSAGEVGHMVIMADGPYAPGGGIRGGIEALASRSAIERDIRAGLAAGRPSVMPDLLKEKDSSTITSGLLAKAVERGDALTIEVLRRAAFYLGLHASALINAFDPEMLVYGGGVVEALGEWLLSQIRDTARQYAINKHRIDAVRIVPAKLGDYAGVVGAGLLAWDTLQVK